mmetsp:Transcript_3160/g.9822  ORF Transcript_3160/g.9822 Transcript_3160/m.9822 type:complete len:141 (+) Transcript_3160:882-1304(+)
MRLTAPQCVVPYFAGICEQVADSILSLREPLRGMLSARIFLSGGVANIPGFEAAISSRLRSMLPLCHHLCFHTVACPEHAAFRGGSILAASPEFTSWCVTRDEWMEEGQRVCAARFNGNLVSSEPPPASEDRASIATASE